MKASAPTLLLAIIAAGVPLGSYSQVGTALAAESSAGSAADLRPAYATPQDVAEGKRVADVACAKCHGAAGISTSKGVPHIAGQRPGYLFTELLVYQSGARGDNAMSNAVKFLKDDALVKVAAYYSGLEPAQPSAAGVAKAPPARPDPASAGKAAAAGCAGCHGETGITKIPGMPSLVGLDPKYFVAAVNAYKSGQRKHDMMKTLVSALSDADMNNIALFYALQKPGKAQTPSPGNQAAGKAAAAACAGCHGEGGVSANAATPSLAGQDAQYFADAMRAYKDGSRADPSMKAPAASVDDNAVKNLAAYYASQQPKQPPVKKAAHDRRAGAALRPLPRRQRQQHRPAFAGAGGAARRLSGAGDARLPERRAQEQGDDGDAGRVVRRRDRASGGPLRESAGAQRRLRDPAAEVNCMGKQT